MEVAVSQTAPPNSPRLRVATRGVALTDETRRSVTATLERLLGLRVDLTEFHRFAARNEQLGPLVKRFRGMKPPRFATFFEGALNSIACQQVTLTLGIRLLNRLAERYGQKLHGGTETAHAFPRPEDIAETTPEELRELGFSRNKGLAMIQLARLGPKEREDLAKLETMPDAEAITRLCELRGIGRWSAEYILLRYLGRTHLFPGDDVGARNNLVEWLSLPAPLDYDGVRQTVEPWAKYGGLLYFHLLLSRLAEGGFLDVEPAALGDQAGAVVATVREAKMMTRQSRKKNAPKAPDGLKPRATRTKPRARPVEDDIVDESGWESFPASDPPAWSPLSTGPPKRD